jgi:hypothetical protein
MLRCVSRFRGNRRSLYYHMNVTRLESVERTGISWNEDPSLSMLAAKIPRQSQGKALTWTLRTFLGVTVPYSWGRQWNTIPYSYPSHARSLLAERTDCRRRESMTFRSSARIPKTFDTVVSLAKLGQEATLEACLVLTAILPPHYELRFLISHLNALFIITVIGPKVRPIDMTLATRTELKFCNVHHRGSINHIVQIGFGILQNDGMSLNHLSV